MRLFDQDQGVPVKVGDEYSRTEFSNSPLELFATV